MRVTLQVVNTMSMLLVLREDARVEHARVSRDERCGREALSFHHVRRSLGAPSRIQCAHAPRAGPEIFGARGETKTWCP